MRVRCWLGHVALLAWHLFACCPVLGLGSGSSSLARGCPISELPLMGGSGSLLLLEDTEAEEACRGSPFGTDSGAVEGGEEAGQAFQELQARAIPTGLLNLQLRSRFTTKFNVTSLQICDIRAAFYYNDTRSVACLRLNFCCARKFEGPVGFTKCSDKLCLQLALKKKKKEKNLAS